MAVASSHQADRQQRSAANPEACAWVAASAGTGKTKVLTDRVLNLLLSGADPQRILCLTFTRAAAGEMSNRLNQRLSDWATLDTEHLKTNLQSLLGHFPTAEQFALARRLFTNVLDAPGGMKILTIHGFCQSLLKRFPLESGVSPHFTVIDETTAHELLVEAQNKVLGQENNLLNDIPQVFDESTFIEVVRALLTDRHKLMEAQDNLDNARKEIELLLDTSVSTRAQDLIQQACAEQNFDREGLASAAKLLEQGGKTDQRKSATISMWINNPTRRAEFFEQYKRAFLTKDGSVVARLASKALVDKFPEILPILQQEADRLYQLQSALNRLQVARISWALLNIGVYILREYKLCKTQRAFLDYDDLVEHIATLLERPDIAPWILYKLDGGIDHVLIDEAQDTNAQQWRVVSTLADEFFAGLGARDVTRTVFVVGDAKQSIYSFQGADPKVFEQMRQHFAEAAAAAKHDWREIALNISFRSTKAILDTVDTVFQQDCAKTGVVPDNSKIQHQTHRQGHGGLVELWPIVEPSDPEEIAPWDPPVQNQKLTLAPPTLLAQAIAGRIQHWLQSEEILASKGRAIMPGDILILVQRRGKFVDNLVKELKIRSVPVAGTDRMSLTEQIAVQDLIALGRFLLLPKDDLTLAVVLKSPFIGLDEEQLFELAYDRGSSTLWEVLQQKMDKDPAYTKAYKYLDDLLRIAAGASPYELYAEVLGPRHGKRALISRLGHNATDPINEFMSLALSYQQTHLPSLQGFLAWLEMGEMEVKRDSDQTNCDEVRIMTVHGSKGLQAPIIFLPDTVRTPTIREKILWANNLPIWMPPADNGCAATDNIKQLAQQKLDDEYCRLLYVALTRAEDRLYICGWRTQKQPKENNWHALVQQALESIGTRFNFKDGWQGTGISYLCPQEVSVASTPPKKQVNSFEHDTLPAWVFDNPAQEQCSVEIIKPSQPPPNNEDSLQRGTIIHKLLQHLPGVPSSRREQFCAQFLEQYPNQNKPHITQSVFNIVEAPEFAAIFGPNSAAEVPVSGWIDGKLVSGQIDRIVVDNSSVLIVDYKTNINPPTSLDGVPQGYIKQMINYKTALQAVYPKHTINCAILWTEAPSLMQLPAETLG